MKRRKRAIRNAILLSFGMYITSLLFPALGGSFRHWSGSEYPGAMSSWTCLIWGWSALVDCASPGWLANFAYFGGLLALWCSRWNMALRLHLMGLSVAVASITLIGREVGVSLNYVFVVNRLELGYYLWLASFLPCCYAAEFNLKWEIRHNNPN